MKRSATLASHFIGKKHKWLALYQRLLARVTRIPGVQVTPLKTFLAITHEDQPNKLIGKIRAKISGLEIALAAPGSRRPGKSALISELSQVDDELLTWIKAASLRARSAKHRST